jgi:hypothetical protein
MAHRGDGLNDIFEHCVTIKENVYTVGGTIQNVPVNPKDIVNKEYCDTHGGGGTTFAITSFTNNVNAVENGVTVDNATFNWTYNKTETDQTISPPLETIPVGTHTKAYTGLGLTSDQTWTLWGTDGVDVDTATSTIYFRNKRYWGADINNDEPNDGEILAMSQELATARQTTKTFDCSGGKYIWFCYPETWGDGEFWVNGLRTTFVKFVHSFTNANGYTEDYSCFRSLYIQNGSAIPVEVR